MLFDKVEDAYVTCAPEYVCVYKAWQENVVMLGVERLILIPLKGWLAENALSIKPAYIHFVYEDFKIKKK